MKQLDELTERIREWIVENFPLAKKRQVGLNDSLLDSGIIDSLGTLDVVQFLEDEYGFEVSDEEMVADHFDSIHSIARFVESKLGGQNGPVESN